MSSEVQCELSSFRLQGRITFASRALDVSTSIQCFIGSRASDLRSFSFSLLTFKLTSIFFILYQKYTAI